MTKRGVLMEGEYRYLTHYGRGELGLEYLPNDAKRGGDRELSPSSTMAALHPAGRPTSTSTGSRTRTTSRIWAPIWTSPAADSYNDAAISAMPNDAGRFWPGCRIIKLLTRPSPPRTRPYKRLPQLYFQASPLRIATGVSMPISIAELVYFDRFVQRDGCAASTWSPRSATRCAPPALSWCPS